MFVTITNKVINKVTETLVAISIGTRIIVIWKYLSKFQHRDLLPLFTEEHHPAQVPLSIIISSEL